MSDVIIRDRIISRYPSASFAQPQFSCDNAAGVAIYGYLKHTGEKNACNNSYTDKQIHRLEAER